MIVALDTTPLASDHKDRGIGVYTKTLYDVLAKYDKKNTYVTFSGGKIPSNAVIVHYPYFDLFRRSLPITSHKIVVTVHDLVPIKYPERFPRGIRGSINWLFQKRALSKVSAIITDSAASKKDIQKIVGVPEERVHVVYLSPRFQETTSTKQASLPKKYVLYVGDVNWNKNVPGLLRAFSHLRKKGFENIYLVLVGKAFINNELAETKEMMDIITYEGIGNYIVRPGYVDDHELPGIYKYAQCLVQPSFDEGFGLPVLEALSIGTPVVVSEAPSLREIAGESATYCSAHSPVDMADKMREVITMAPAVRRQRIDQGKRQSSLFYDHEMALETTNVYTKILAS
jgi:glycosyltransferase involved in cell wall biosynthesis